MSISRIVFQFDFRIYVLVTSVNPLRIYLYKSELMTLSLLILLTFLSLEMVSSGSQLRNSLQIQRYELIKQQCSLHFAESKGDKMYKYVTQDLSRKLIALVFNFPAFGQHVHPPDKLQRQQEGRGAEGLPRRLSGQQVDHL